MIIKKSFIINLLIIKAYVIKRILKSFVNKLKVSLINLWSCNKPSGSKYNKQVNIQYINIVEVIIKIFLTFEIYSQGVGLIVNYIWYIL